MKAMRFSGLPLKLESLEVYKKEWELAFDELKNKHGNDMLSLHSELATLETKLLETHKVTEDWKFLGSQKALKAKLEEFQCPIMVAQSSENPKELVYVIMDQPL